jgi:hypothetical protein
MSFDVAVANEKKGTNWKVVSTSWGGEDLSAVDKILTVPEFNTSRYEFRDNNKTLAIIDTKEKTIDIHMTEIDKQGYSVRTHKH